MLRSFLLAVTIVAASAPVSAQVRPEPLKAPVSNVRATSQPADEVEPGVSGACALPPGLGGQMPQGGGPPPFAGRGGPSSCGVPVCELAGSACRAGAAAGRPEGPGREFEEEEVEEIEIEDEEEDGAGRGVPGRGARPEAVNPQQSGQRSVVRGQSAAPSLQRSAVSGQPSAAPARRPAAQSQRPAAQSQRPAAQSQRPAAGAQRPVTGQRPAAVGRPAAAGRPTATARPTASGQQRPAASTQRPATGAQRPSASGQPRRPAARPLPQTVRRPSGG